MPFSREEHLAMTDETKGHPEEQELQATGTESGPEGNGTKSEAAETVLQSEGQLAADVEVSTETTEGAEAKKPSWERKSISRRRPRAMRAEIDKKALSGSERRESAGQAAAESGKMEQVGSQVDYSRTFRSLSAGDVVEGVVVHIDKEGVLVDVGTKSEGLIRPNELAIGPVQSGEEVVSVGESIDVYVVNPENEEGNPVLSKKRADFERAWERVQQAYEDGKVLSAMVTDRVKGGLVVDLGIRGFVPGSHVGSGNVRNLDRYVGQSLPLKVIEVDRERRKVILSHRLATEQERTRRREETMASLVEGEIREGVVRRVTDYGAFVDLGGVDGLLHISEMSWTRVGHPSEVVKVGQKVDVMVLRLNPEAGRISLGLRQILPDPWADVESRYEVGQVVSGSVSRLVPFGAFVQLEGGIEGIIPNAELSVKRVNRPEDVVSVGDSVEARIADIRPEERRMTLSIRWLHEEKDRKRYQDSGSDGRMTLGDLVGHKLQELAAGAVEEEEEVEETPEPAEEPQVEESAEVVEPAETPADAEAGGETASSDEAASEGGEPVVEKAEEPKAKPKKRARRKE